MNKKRFVMIDDGEIYYITDTKGLKTLNDYIEEFSKAEYEFTEEEALSTAKEEYWQMIYENSMSANENVNMLNDLLEENEKLKSTNMEMEDYLARLEEKNEQLKKRNENQYNQLNELWRLIEDEDYNTLRSMLNQLEEDEKRLQQEWWTYNDL